MTKILVRGEPKPPRKQLSYGEMIAYLTKMGVKWDLMDRPVKFFSDREPDYVELDIRSVYGFDGEFAAIGLKKTARPLPRDDES